MKPADYDILVVGGGIAGLAFARLLDVATAARLREPLRMAVLEARPPEVLPAGAETGLRVFAIAAAGREVLEACGAWQAVPAARISPYERMRVWHEGSTPTGPGSIAFDSAEAGVSNLGHIVEHDWVRRALWDVLAGPPGSDAGNIDLLTGQSPLSLRQEPDAMVIRLADDRELRSRLVVGADGADSWVRTQLAVPTMKRDYHQLALVGHVGTEKPHQRTAWQCFTAGGPVALLPLADGRCSIVWSCFEPEARELLALADEEFGARLTAATGHVLGTLLPTTRRVALPLAALHARRYTGARFALIGDAAHQIHPLAGQGINLGLLDARALAEVLAGQLVGTRLADPGDARLLRRYERSRKGANLLTLAAMEGLHRVFTAPSPALTKLAAAGLGAVDRFPALKRMFMNQAAGKP